MKKRIAPPTPPPAPPPPTPAPPSSTPPSPPKSKKQALKPKKYDVPSPKSSKFRTPVIVPGKKFKGKV